MRESERDAFCFKKEREKCVWVCVKVCPSDRPLSDMEMAGELSLAVLVSVPRNLVSCA